MSPTTPAEETSTDEPTGVKRHAMSDVPSDPREAAARDVARLFAELVGLRRVVEVTADATSPPHGGRRRRAMKDVKLKAVAKTRTNDAPDYGPRR